MREHQRVIYSGIHIQFALDMEVVSGGCGAGTVGAVIGWLSLRINEHARFLFFGYVVEKFGVFFVEADAAVAVASHYALVQGGASIVEHGVGHGGVVLAAPPFAGFPFYCERAGGAGVLF